MSKNNEVHTEDESLLDQEATNEGNEEQSYDDEFEAMWGSGEPKDDESSEPSQDEEVEEVDEEETPAEEEEDDEEQEVPPEESKASKPGEPAQSTDDPYAWIDSLPEEVRDQARALRNQAASHQGRATAFQRRVNELQDELRRLEKARADQPADRTSKETESAAQKRLKKLEQLKEDFPEFAEALEEVREYERQEVNRRLQETLRPYEEQQARQRADAFQAAVDAEAAKIFNTQETGVHWKQVVEGDDFLAWLEMQPKSVQQAARTPDPQEAIFVLRRYEDDYQRAVKELGLDQSDKDTSQNSDSNKTSRAKQLKEERAKRKATSTAPASRPADGNRDKSGGSYEDMFEAMWGS